MPICWYNLLRARFGGHPLEPGYLSVISFVASYSIYLFVMVEIPEWNGTEGKSAKRVVLAFCYYMPYVGLLTLQAAYGVYVMIRSMIRRRKYIPLGDVHDDGSDLSTAQLLAKSAPESLRLGGNCRCLLRQLSDEIKDAGRVKYLITSTLLLKCLKAKRNAQEFWIMRRLALEPKDDSTNISTKAVKCDSLPSIYSFDDNSSLLDDEPRKESFALGYQESHSPPNAVTSHASQAKGLQNADNHVHLQVSAGAVTTHALSPLRPKSLSTSSGSKMPKEVAPNKVKDPSSELPATTFVGPLSSTTTNGISPIIAAPPCTPMESTPVDEPKGQTFGTECVCLTLDEADHDEPEPSTRVFQKRVSISTQASSMHKNACSQLIYPERLLVWSGYMVAFYSFMVLMQIVCFVLEWVAILKSLHELATLAAVLGVLLYYVPYPLMILTFSCCTRQLN